MESVSNQNFTGDGQEFTKSQRFLETDNSLEFGKSCEDLSWNHRTSTPCRSETNGIAERAFRRVKEGTSAVLLQSGLDDNWWSDSMDAVAICEMSKTSWQTGKLCVNEDLENLSKDQFFHSVHWWNTS